MRRVWVVAAAAGLILFLASPVQAKGGGLELDEQVQRNEVLSADEVFFDRDKSMAKEYLAGGPFYAYLSPYVPGRALRQAPPLPKGATLLGPIEIRGYEKVGRWWSVRFGVDFTIPDVPLGSYRIDVCTAPCTRTIEELYPTVTRVVSGPLEERLEERINDFQLDIYKAMHAADNRLERHLERRAQKDLNGLREYTRVRLDRQGERIDELTTTLQGVCGAPPPISRSLRASLGLPLRSGL